LRREFEAVYPQIAEFAPDLATDFTGSRRFRRKFPNDSLLAGILSLLWSRAAGHAYAEKAEDRPGRHFEFARAGAAA
jgi:hypothetical protein